MHPIPNLPLASVAFGIGVASAVGGNWVYLRMIKSLRQSGHDFSYLGSNPIKSLRVRNAYKVEFPTGQLRTIYNLLALVMVLALATTAYAIGIIG